MANANGWGDGSVNNNIGWGQAPNNNISWGKSQITSWSGATDIDGGNAPANTVAPAITGTAQEGQTLTCSTGTWSGSPSYTYQWKRNGSNIGSATNSTYVLVTADVGQSIKCTVTATNFIGSASADSNTVTPTSSTDPDAQAFITAAAITNPTQQSAINQLVIGLKADGLWTKMKALYPFVGGSNTSNSYNLKNTAQFQISWAGGVTSSANGVTVVTNGYGNTAFNMSTQITSVNSWAVGVYVNQYTAGGIDLGADLNGLDNFYHSIKWDAFWGANTGRFSTNSALAFTDTNGLGLTVSTRNSALNKKVYKAGSEIANAATASAGTFFNGNVFLGALNRNGSASFYSGKRYAFAFICDGSLNATENTNLNTRVTTFQTTLNRL